MEGRGPGHRGGVRVVAVPGLGLDERSLRPVLERVETTTGVRYEVVHLPGMGRRGVATVEEGAEKLTEEVGRGPVVLLGHSASCQTVARAARTLEARGLVLVGPTTDPDLRSWPRMLRAWGRTARHEPLWQVPVLVRQYVRTGPWSMLRTMDLIRRERIEYDLSRLDVPVLVLRGRDDRIAAEEWARRCVQASGPGSQTVSVPGGHMIVQTAPGEVASEVAGFLQWVGGPEVAGP